MFEQLIDPGLDARGCADALDGWVLRSRRIAAERLILVGQWADLHPPESAIGQRSAWAGSGGLAERGHPADPAVDPVTSVGRGPSRHSKHLGVRLGAEGTPAVTEFAATELGMLLQTTTVSAAALLRDVLELRHRMPRLWEAALAGEVEEWQARKVVALTRPLTLEQARVVDTETVEAVTGLPFGRARAVVEGRVIAADPDAHEARRQAEAQRRYVAVSRRENPAGLRTLMAQTTGGDVARLMGMVNLLADRLTASGDDDPVELRRAKALGVLANPALACVLLARTQPEEVAPPLEVPPDGTEPSAAERDEPAAPSAAELAVQLGRALTSLGTKALDRLRPRTVLYLHLADEALTSHPGTTGAQVVRTSTSSSSGVDLGPIGVEQLREWLGTDTVIIKPVIDPAGQVPVDAYEVPGSLAEAIELREPYEVFPYGTLPSATADIDHTKAYVPPGDGGPPGQTSMGNLGPLGRSHHRAKTFGGFTCHQPLPGLYLWRTPTGYWYQVDHTGTHRLGPEPRLSPVERAFARRIHENLAA